MALGLSIAGAVFVNKAVAGLASVLPNTARAQLLATVSGTSNSVFNNLPSETKALALNAIVAALSNTFVFFPQSARNAASSKLLLTAFRFILVYVAASISLLCSCIITVSTPVVLGVHPHNLGLTNIPQRLNMGKVMAGAA